MGERSAEEAQIPCTCFPVPRLASLDGSDGWRLTDDDCRHHGRNYFGNRPAMSTPPGKADPR